MEKQIEKKIIETYYSSLKKLNNKLKIITIVEIIVMLFLMINSQNILYLGIIIIPMILMTGYYWEKQTSIIYEDYKRSIFVYNKKNSKN